MKVLIIIDPQYDFMDNGLLPIKGAWKAMRNLSNYINNHEFDKMYITLDWHPSNHCSFKQFGGIFPKHCIGGTKGAEPVNILEPFDWEIIRKGLYSDVEEFGAFDYIPVDIMQADEIIIAGVAGDICVLHSVEQLFIIKDKIKLYMPGIASLNQKILDEFIKNNNIQTIC